MERHGGWDSLRQHVMSRTTPSEEEAERVEKFYKRTEEELTRLLKKAGFEAVAEAHGSIVRGTWLSGEKDVDIFLILDPKYDRSVLARVLDIAKAYVGEGWVEAYAEHPYIKAVIEGFDVEFVPCFRVDPAKGLISATDRTPLHTRYVNERLSFNQRADVRLLKQFMKGVGVYGAEVKVGGFSGYLCELLIIHLGSFETVLERASGWSRAEIIGNTSGMKSDNVRRKFREPLIVVDPVDPNRNVASAVSETAFWTFTAAARSFLDKPAERYFFPHVESPDPAKLIEGMRKREPKILFIVVEDGDVPVPDVLWGQLYRAQRVISNFVRKEEYALLRSAVWSDEASRHILIFELGSEIIPTVVRNTGPPVEMADGSKRFLQAHLGAESTVSGPWIEGKRWWVESRREHHDVRSLIESALKDGGRNIGVPTRLGEKIAHRKSILLNDEIASHLTGDFVRFLDRFLKGRPSWLD